MSGLMETYINNIMILSVCKNDHVSVCVCVYTKYAHCVCVCVCVLTEIMLMLRLINLQRHKLTQVASLQLPF